MRRAWVAVVAVSLWTAAARADEPAPAPAPAPAPDEPAPVPADPPAPKPEPAIDVEAPPIPPPRRPAPPPPPLPATHREPAPAAPRTPPAPYAYRYQLIIADSAVVLTSLLVDQLAEHDGEQPSALASMTIASYLFTAPLIHGIHRQGWRALASFGLRAGLPIALGYLGEKLDGTPPCDICRDTLRSDGKIAGMTAGVLLAMVADTVLTRPLVPRTESSADRRPRPGRAWAPAVQPLRGGALAGLAGAF